MSWYKRPILQVLLYTTLDTKNAIETISTSIWTSLSDSVLSVCGSTTVIHSAPLTRALNLFRPNRSSIIVSTAVDTAAPIMLVAAPVAHDFIASTIQSSTVVRTFSAEVSNTILISLCVKTISDWSSSFIADWYFLSISTSFPSQIVSGIVSSRAQLNANWMQDKKDSLFYWYFCNAKLSFWSFHFVLF